MPRGFLGGFLPARGNWLQGGGDIAKNTYSWVVNQVQDVDYFSTWGVDPHLP